MLEFLTLKPETFGLDITDSSLRIAKLKKKRGVLSLASFREVEIKPGIIEEGEIKNEDALTEIIKRALTKVKGEKLRTRYIVASLPEEKSFSQVIQMPKMKEEELQSAVLFEAENYIPLPLNQVYLDFQNVPPVRDHLDHFDVLIAALPKTTIDPYILCFKKAGLRPHVLEIESQSIARALVKNETSSSTILLIDFGKNNTGFIIFSGRSIRFTSSIPISSQQLTKAVSQVLKVDLEKAEQLKIKHGLQITKQNTQSKQISEAMTPILIDLVEQIKKYLAFYQTHTSYEHLPVDSKGVEKVLLCGGGANLKGLSPLLSKELKIPVELGNPWVNILSGSLKETPNLSYEKSLSYTTVLGLALRAIKEK